jgi:hypothetical protein
MNRRLAPSDPQGRQRRVRRIRLPAMLILLAALGATVGCAHQFPDYPARTAGDCTIHVAADGAALGAEPIFDRATAEQYFEVDMAGRGILPVYVVVENHAPGRTLLASREQFSIVDVKVAGDKNDVANSTAGAIIAMTGAVAISAPLLFIGGAMASDADNVKTNFDRKAFQPQTVSPGSSASGFVFFKIPSGDRTKQWRLRANLQDIRQVPVGPIEATITNPEK